MKADNFIENSGGSKKLYTGIGRFQIIAINPSQEELAKIYNSSNVKEPNYEREEGARLDFYLKEVYTDEIMKMAIFVSNKIVKSRDESKTQFLNLAGQSFYYTSVQEIEEKNAMISEDEAWRIFRTEGLREAREGEAKVIDLLKALFNLSNDVQNSLEFDNWNKIANGNVRELRELVDKANQRNRTVCLLCGVKDEKYQDIYTNLFLPHGYREKAEARLWKDASNNFKSFYTTTSSLQEYNPMASPTDAEVEDDSPFNDMGNTSANGSLF